jgi:hypothetical protein
MSNLKIGGTTWDVYLYILTAKSQGVRDIWRGLELSSPSLAQYHVNKLLDLGLIEATPAGKYRVNEVAQTDILRNFIILRGTLMPRLVIYGTFILGLFTAYLFFWPFTWNARDLFTIVIFLFSIVTFYWEAYNQSKLLHNS